MNLIELIITALCLSADAFAAAICKGLSVKKVKFWQPILCGLYFGAFQAIMPTVGYLLGARFKVFISNAAPTVAFLLLIIIGVNMIREAGSGEEYVAPLFSPRAMLPVAVATSIDALAVGVSLSMLPDTDIKASALVIGGVTFLLSSSGLIIGYTFGKNLGKRAKTAGGVILIILGLKILLEHFIIK